MADITEDYWDTTAATDYLWYEELWAKDLNADESDEDRADRIRRYYEDEFWDHVNRQSRTNRWKSHKDRKRSRKIPRRSGVRIRNLGDRLTESQ